MSIRTELEKDRSSGKSRGVPRPWNTFDPADEWLKDVEDKANDVSLGVKRRFTKDETDQLLAYFIRNGI